MKTYRWIFLVLVAGIFVGCQKDSEPELIGDWTRNTTSIFPGSARSHAASFVIGNMGYVVGGNNGVTSVLRNEAYEFDHEQGDWKRMKDFQGRARYQAVGFAINGKGYVGTGYGWVGEGKERELQALRDFYQFDPNIIDTDGVRGVWVEVAPLPEKWGGQEGAKVRRAAIAFSLQDNESKKWYGYVGTGFTDVPDKEYLMDFWRFDSEGTTINPDDPDNPWIGRWEPVNGYRGNKRHGAAVFVIDNKAYICSGGNPTNLNDFWRFDPNASDPTLKWIYNRPDERGIIITRPMSDANPDEDYDDDYGTLPRKFGVAYVVDVNQKIGGAPDLRGHIVGGEAGYGYTNWEYNHKEDLWVQRTRFYNHLDASQSRAGMISFSFPNTGRTFVGLGTSGAQYYEDIWEFIPMIEDNVYNDRY